MKFIFILLFVSVVGLASSQQKTISIQFALQYNLMPIEIGKKYVYQNDSVEIQTLKFYISDIQFYQNNKRIDAVQKKHHLIDIENPASQNISHSIERNMQFNRVRFSIGVDSATNEAGAIGGDLDPTNGMYWAWQSGYINFKLEGSSPICPARKNQFTFHIGGYQYPYNTIQNLDLPVADNSNIVIGCDVNVLLSQINLGELYEVMSPNEKALGIAKKIITAFSIAK